MSGSSGLAGTLNNADNKVDPMLGEVVATVSFGVPINAVSVLQGDRVNVELARPATDIIGISWEQGRQL
jgi:hypothetical protein